MSVAEDDTGHHNNKNHSRSYGSRNPPQEYRDNHIINKQIPKGNTRRQSPLPLVPAVIIAAHPNSSTQNSTNAPLVVERILDDAASQNHDSPNSTTIPTSSNGSHLALSKDPTNTNTNTNTTTTASPSADATMRAPHAVAAVKVRSPTPATTTTTIALATTTQSGPPSPTMSNPHAETETSIKDTASLSPVPSNGSTNATAAVSGDTPVQSKSKTHTPLPPQTQTHTQTQTRPKVTTPASPPPSPRSAVGTAVTVTVTGGSGGTMVDSPLALLSAATVQSNSATPVRSGSLASLIHSTHREVELPESTRAGGEAHGTPLSPTSMSYGTHSRKDSAATMASASTTGTVTGTEMDMSLKGGTSGEPMDIDIDPSPTTTAPLPPPQQQPRSGSGTGSASHTPAGLGNKTAPLPYLPSRSPQPQQHPSSGAMLSSLGPHQHHHHHHRPPPSSSPIPSLHPQPSNSAYPHSSSAAPHLQRRSSHQSHSRSYSGRTTGSGTNSGAGTAPPQPHSTPRQLSPSSQLRSFVRSDLSPGAAAAGAGGGSDEHERESGGYLNIPVSEYDEMRMQLAQFASQDEVLRAQRDSLARIVDRLEANERYRTQVVRGVSEWLKSGQTLMHGLADTAGVSSTFNGRGHGHGHPLDATGERDHERERDRAQLSSAMVGGAHRQQYIEREKTLSVVLPSSPYTSGPHGRPGSGYGPGPGQDSYPYRHTATPTHAESASHLSRGTGHATRPTHQSTGSNSLRRSRRPSSDDLAEHGGKRIKANNGTIIRTSPDAADRASHSIHHPGPLSASGIGHTLGRTSALGVGRDGTGEFTSYPTSHNRGSGSFGSGTEHGRESPLNRRTMPGREDEEDEFPSPRRPHAAPPGAQAATGNGLVSAPTAGRPVQPRMAALIAGGDDADAIGSPDIDTAGHETLMEMVEEEDGDSLRRGAMRHVRGSVLRNGSRSSMTSQDIDDMIAEVADDRGGGGNGVVRSSSSSAKPRYRGPGQYHEAMSPGLTRSYTPSQASPTKFIPTSSASPAPQQNNSRGFVFRNMDVADMEAQAQARSPEELAHRPSLSGSGSFNGAQTSPPGTSGNPVTTQFLPPQSGPPQPKKVYHSKGTGQIIGSQHAASMERVPTLPVETVVQPRPLPSSNSLTVDGLPKRTCKQCGQPGRYKDNKCVEKWGPGPQGPGTVCDRCRKKMKRVEKRATQDSAAMNAAINHHQYPIAPAPSGVSGGSFGQAPNQGSQRLEESQEYGFSQATEDGQTQPSLSRAPSQNHSSILQGSQAGLGRRGSHAPDQSMHRDATLPYPPNPARETMPPPTSFSTAYGSPKPNRSSRREPSAETRDGDLDADGDAEMDELADDEIAAAADAVVGNRRSRGQEVKPEA